MFRSLSTEGNGDMESIDMDQSQKRNGRTSRWDNPFPIENDSQSESALGRDVDHNTSEQSLKSSHLNLLSSVDSEELSQSSDDQLTAENMSLLLMAIQKHKMAHQAASSPRSAEKETLCSAGGPGPAAKKKVFDYGHKSKYEGPKGNTCNSAIAMNKSVEKFQTQQAASLPAVSSALISSPKNTRGELIRQVEPQASTPKPQAVPPAAPANKTPRSGAPATVPTVMLPVVPPMTLVPPVAQPAVKPAMDQPVVPSAPPFLEIESTNDKYLQACRAKPPNRAGQATDGQKNVQKESRDRFESPFGVVKASWLPVFSHTDTQKTRELPDPSQMNDYFAVTPRVFPRICSLCNKECKDKTDWIQHQNSGVHMENCHRLCLQYPDWNPEVGSLSKRHPEVSSSSKRHKDDGEERHTSRRRSASPSLKRSRCSSSGHSRHGTQSPSRSSANTRCRTRSRSRSSGHTKHRTRSRSRSSGHTKRRTRSRSRSSGHTRHRTRSRSRNPGHTRHRTRSRSRSSGRTKHQSPSRSSGHTKHQTRSPSRSSGRTRRRTQSRSRSSVHTKRRTRSQSRSSGHTKRRTRSRSRSSGHTKRRTRSRSRSPGHIRRRTRSRSRSPGHIRRRTRSRSRSPGHTRRQARSRSRSPGHTRRRTQSRSRSPGHTRRRTRSRSRSSDYPRNLTRSRSRSSGRLIQSRPRSQSPWRLPSSRPRSRSPWKPQNSSRWSCTSSSMERESGNSRRSPERERTWTPHSENRHDEQTWTRGSSNYREKSREDLEWTGAGGPRQTLHEETGRQEQKRDRFVPRGRTRDDPEHSALASLTEKSVLQAVAQLQDQGGAGRRLHRGRDSTHLAAGRADTPAVPSDLVSMIQLVTKQVIEAVWDSQDASSRRPSTSEQGRNRQQCHSPTRKANDPCRAGPNLQQTTSSSSRANSQNVADPDTHRGHAKSSRGKTKREVSPCLRKDTSQSDTAKDKHVVGPCPKKDGSSSGKAKDKNVAGLCPKKDSSSSGKAKEKNVAGPCPKKDSSSSGKAKDKNVAGPCPKKDGASSGKTKDKNVAGPCLKKDTSLKGKVKKKRVADPSPQPGTSVSGEAEKQPVEAHRSHHGTADNGKAENQCVVDTCTPEGITASVKEENQHVLDQWPQQDIAPSDRAANESVMGPSSQHGTVASSKAEDLRVADPSPQEDTSVSSVAENQGAASPSLNEGTAGNTKAENLHVVSPSPNEAAAVSSEAENQGAASPSLNEGTGGNTKAENLRVADPSPQEDTSVSSVAKNQGAASPSLTQGTGGNTKAENLRVADPSPQEDTSVSSVAKNQGAASPSLDEGTAGNTKAENLRVASPSPQEDTSVSSVAKNQGAASPSLDEGTAGNTKAENLRVASPSPQEDSSVSAEAESKRPVALGCQEGHDLSSKAGGQDTELEPAPGAGTGTCHHLGTPERVSKPRVRIYGDSLVISAQERASLTTGLQLGLEESLVLEWHGQEGMTWTRLLPVFQNLAAQGQALDVLIIHLGGNDLAPAFDSASFSTVKRVFFLLRELLPQVRVIWSEIIPQGIWHGGERNRQRKKLNTDVGKCVRSRGGAVIKHPRISSEDTKLYIDKANLSDAGLDRFLEDIKGGILAHVLQSSRAAGGRLKKGTDLPPLAPSVTSGLVSADQKVATQEGGAVSSSEEGLRRRRDTREGAATSQVVSGKAENSGVASPGPHPGLSGSPEVTDQGPRIKQDLEVVSMPASSAVPADLPSVSQEAATGEDEAVSSSEEASGTQTNRGDGAVSSQPVSSRADNSGAASPSPQPEASGSSKAENQDEERDLVVGNVSPRSGNPGPASKLRVWICGQTVIVSAQKQASSTAAGSQLGLGESVLLEWHGQEEMTWPDLVPALRKLAAQGQAPDGLIVHLGENDLLCSRGVQLSCTIKEELGLVKELFPQARILWSNLLLRRRGFGKCGSRTVNRARGMVNLEVGQFIGSLEGAVIEHPAILHTVPDLYEDGDNLSGDGLDLFLEDIKNGILAHFPS